jgi:hypothetical protein
MAGWLAAFALGVTLPPAVSRFCVWLVSLLPGVRGSFIGGWVGACAGMVLSADPDWPRTCGAAVSAVIALAIWWYRRRRGRRGTGAALGAKARAKIAAMKQAMRERARPRPVLRPGLQGAG